MWVTEPTNIILMCPGAYAGGNGVSEVQNAPKIFIFAVLERWLIYDCETECSFFLSNICGFIR